MVLSRFKTKAIMPIKCLQTPPRRVFYFCYTVYMTKTEHILKSFTNALGVFIYVCFVAWLGSHSQQLFGEEQKFLMPVLALLLFVFSASITGLLVLGKPIHLYLNNFKKEALTLLLYTLGWLMIFIILTALALAYK
jgi:hypothetical protein